MSQRKALKIIVIAQFLGTSLWFAGNAAAPQFSAVLGEENLIGWITSAVQFGFILGTLTFAIFSIPDRYKPSDVFFFSAVMAAAFNLLLAVIPPSFWVLISGRFLVGFFLAGIYPVGMKIAADYFEKGLGMALGFLVGALVLGTASPHLIASLDFNVSWKLIFWSTSLFAILGGAMVGFFVPDGPYRKPLGQFDWNLIPSLLKIDSLKSAATGYFGHMWELYTFWAFCPALILYFQDGSNPSNLTSFIAFSVIGIGGISCAIGGWFSEKYSSRSVALFALAGSGICCLAVLLIPEGSIWIWISFLLIWGILVTADSPQFSTLVAQSVPAEFKGTALTLVNCAGFALTIFSIALADFLLGKLEIQEILALLAIGPVFGIVGFLYFDKKKRLSTKASSSI
ncbi:MFS transporter [Algoriphagus namhaensis]|uniref:MFS transporter n=1 Tax=Algoriphagus namhaensis TaxID=915353 RepID=A0ABV8ATG7_9BACT